MVRFAPPTKAATDPIGTAKVATDGRFLQTDRALQQLLGYSGSELERLRFHDITHAEDLLRDEAQFERVLARGCGAYSILKRYVRGTGETLWTELCVTLIRDASGTPDHFVSRIRPLETDPGLLDDLHCRATRDALTGLLNRGQLDDQLCCAETHARRTGGRFALLSIDLDGFKQINDSCGHTAGDGILRAVAPRIARQIDPGDVAGRAGGDEFMAILRDIDTCAGLERRRARLQACFARPFETATGPLHLAASFGTAIFPDDAGTVGQLIDVADARMYEAKLRRFTRR
ncbi:GGDEF domain-containing protein [Roseovarius aestuariivivens]|uniref:GGDEF domain-containing protein n=1 Tax=Roseovarius aestuariivivens TaxID=1888910 RepID=UPI001081F293|nr:GGDEF domain-containing protein [Roseovarius aestuariivivens]